MKLSLDTNTVIEAALKDDYCQYCLNKYLEQEENGDAFITPQVKDESIDFAAKLTQFTLYLRKKMESEQISLEEAVEKTKQFYNRELDQAIESQFSNVIDHFKEEMDADREFREVEKEVIQKIRILHSGERNIKPPQGAINPENERWKQVQENIEENNLAKGYDKEVLMQLWKYQDMKTEEIELLTINEKDFRNTDPTWNQKFDRIHITSPKDKVKG